MEVTITLIFMAVLLCAVIGLAISVRKIDEQLGILQVYAHCTRQEMEAMSACISEEKRLQ